MNCFPFLDEGPSEIKKDFFLRAWDKKKRSPETSSLQQQLTVLYYTGLEAQYDYTYINCSSSYSRLLFIIYIRVIIIIIIYIY